LYWYVFAYSTRVCRTATFLATVRCLVHVFFTAALNSVLLPAQRCVDGRRPLR